MAIGKTNRAIFAALALSCASVAGVAAVAVGSEPEVVDAAMISINPANGLRMYDGRPFTGISQKHNLDGRLAESDSFVEGLRDGPSRIWFPDGRMAYETHFKQGLRAGVSRTWWSNRNLRSRAMFLADRQEGEAWAWYKTGEEYKRHFYKNGVPTGLQQAWRKNGKLYENFEIRNGKSYGLRNSKICAEVKEPVP